MSKEESHAPPEKEHLQEELSEPLLIYVCMKESCKAHGNPVCIFMEIFIHYSSQ